MRIIARSDELAWANDEGRLFTTKVNVHGIKRYALHVSIMPRKYRTQNSEIVRISSEEQKFDSAELDSALDSSRGARNLPRSRALYASTTTIAMQRAKRQLNNANAGTTNAKGRVQEPGQTSQYPVFDEEMCVNEATWNSLTRICCSEDSEVQ